MSKSDLNFKRKERKYLVLEHNFEEIKEELTSHIPIHLIKGKNPYHIETTYLDTKDHLLFHEYLNKRSSRFKIRLRKYSNSIEYYLVELKVKHNGISQKKRFILPGELLKDFLRGKDIKAKIKEANTGLVGAMKTYKLISNLITLNDFVPVLRSSYERVAFQKKSKKIRITVDRNIKHEKLLGKAKTTTLDALVLESKIMGKTPKWYKKMANELSLLRQKRFSKFTTGINSLYYPARGKYNFELEENIKEEIPQKVLDSFELMKKYLKLEDKIV